MVRVVVIAYDGSENAEVALAWYFDKCRKPDDAIHGIYIKQVTSLPVLSWREGLKPPVTEWADIMKKVNADIEVAEKSYTAAFLEKRIMTNNQLEVVGNAAGESADPGKLICNFINNKKADLVIMGTRGLNVVRRTIMGSVSDYVLHHADCPVAVVPAKKPETK